ncbi:hypothetical protein GCM10010123_41990 [Pilimelia anulata]|uniref:Fibronectin type-III domain-containing protein n=1 Tax=Pilimelia anulata TaxID=53371 RepID=A0A8J3FCY3_9ACTN|nr:fibronectin type III domain-containing protein [Pilimelia anulata]GGK07620.1 hypothetical protein GCM10010123_41990 [Pilimelia anulata]
MRTTSTLLRPLAVAALATAAALGVGLVNPAAAQAGVYDPGPTPNPAPVAGAPGRPVADTTCVWPTVIRVVWNAPSTSWSSPVLEYDVRAYFLDNRQAGARSVGSSYRKVDVTGLRPGQRYQVKVRARNAKGWGEWSNAAYTSTPWW